GIALVVVINELDRTSQESAFDVDVVAPNFQRQQILLAVGRNRARQCHAEADLDRIGRARRRYDTQDDGEQNGEQGARNGASCGGKHRLLPPPAPVTAATAWRFALLVASAKSNAAGCSATPSSSQAADLPRMPDQEVKASTVAPEGACLNSRSMRDCG